MSKKNKENLLDGFPFGQPADFIYEGAKGRLKDIRGTHLNTIARMNKVAKEKGYNTMELFTRFNKKFRTFFLPNVPDY